MNILKSVIIFLLFILLLAGCKATNNQEEQVEKLEKMNDELMSQLNDVETQLMLQIEELQSLNEEVGSSEYINHYMSSKWSVFGGYYEYSSDESPFIYPDESAPHVHDEVTRWLKENPVVEVIMRTNNGLYLARIPTIENYVYVSENSLIELDADDIPEIPLGDISVNDCSIGDSIEKLKLTFDGKTTYGVENGAKMVGFFSNDAETVFEEKALCFVDEYKRIIGFRFSSDEFILDNQFTIGDLAKEAINHYDDKFGRDETYKNDGYEHENERYVYIIGEYFLEFGFDTEELTDTSRISYVSCRKKWW